MLRGNWCYVLLFFFFSSRRRHTRFDCDWSSDVCSSDLVALDDVRHLVPSGDALVADLDDLVALAETGGLGRRTGHDRFHVGGQVGEGGHEQRRAGGQPGGEDEVGQQQIEDRTGRDDGRAPEERRVGERPLFVLRAHLVAEVLAQHLHVAAERDRGDDILGLADLAAGQLRPEADGELQDLDSAAPGDPEVAEFVEGDEGAEGDREGERVESVVLDGLHARRALLRTCSLVYHRGGRDYFTAQVPTTSSRRRRLLRVPRRPCAARLRQ